MERWLQANKWEASLLLALPFALGLYLNTLSSRVPGEWSWPELPCCCGHSLDTAHASHARGRLRRWWPFGVLGTGVLNVLWVGLFAWPFVPTGSVFGFVSQGAAVVLSDVLEFVPSLAVGFWAARGIRGRRF